MTVSAQLIMSHVRSKTLLVQLILLIFFRFPFLSKFCSFKKNIEGFSYIWPSSLNLRFNLLHQIAIGFLDFGFFSYCVSADPMFGTIPGGGGGTP